MSRGIGEFEFGPKEHLTSGQIGYLGAISLEGVSLGVALCVEAANASSILLRTATTLIGGCLLVATGVRAYLANPR